MRKIMNSRWLPGVEERLTGDVDGLLQIKGRQFLEIQVYSGADFVCCGFCGWLTSIVRSSFAGSGKRCWNCNAKLTRSCHIAEIDRLEEELKFDWSGVYNRVTPPEDSEVVSKVVMDYLIGKSSKIVLAVGIREYDCLLRFALNGKVSGMLLSAFEEVKDLIKVEVVSGGSWIGGSSCLKLMIGTVTVFVTRDSNSIFVRNGSNHQEI